MDEEMEYAEMLEIPVSTVKVTKKRGRKPKKQTELKEEVISKVNENNAEIVGATPPAANEENVGAANTNTGAQAGNGTSVPPVEAERLVAASDGSAVLPAETMDGAAFVAESIPVSIPRRRKRPFFARLFGRTQSEWEYDEPQAATASAPAINPDNDGLPMYNQDLWEETEREEKERKEKRYSLIVGIEFAASFALCLGIFLTNVFLPESAINTFFRSLQKTEEADARTYSDFTLSSVFSEENAALTISPTGILSFQEKGCVYPAVDGTVSEVAQNSDGTWTVKITHSPTFSEIISGLTYASCAVGGEVKSNVPVGYSDGQNEVQVSMYESGSLLSCIYLTENGELAWAEE